MFLLLLKRILIKCGFYFQLLYNGNIDLLKDTTLTPFTMNKLKNSKDRNLPEDQTSQKKGIRARAHTHTKKHWLKYSCKIWHKTMEPMRKQH